jgi:ribonuclease HII
MDKKTELLLKEIDFKGFKQKINSKNNKKVLLHTCCAPCASGVVLKLKYHYKMEIVSFFYNPNIYPEKEYKRRYRELLKLSEFFEFNVIEGEYKPDIWFKKTERLKNEPEGGIRCNICYSIRLLETAKKAKELNIPYFTTTLTISPHMNNKIINRIGKNLEKKTGVKFIEENFKKENGYLYSVRISKKLNIYRQHYCGCLYSIPSDILTNMEE